MDKKCRDCGDMFKAYMTTDKFCFRCRYKNTRPIRIKGKKAIKWDLFKKDIPKLIPKTGKYYICGICDKPIRNGLTWDHIKPRSNRPDLIFEISNIQPAHYICNGIKGSKHKGDSWKL